MVVDSLVYYYLNINGTMRNDLRQEWGSIDSGANEKVKLAERASQDHRDHHASSTRPI